VRKIIFAILLVMAGLVYAEPTHRCSSAAIKQAQRLLYFHAGPDNRIAVEDAVKVLSPIHNPANKNQLFDVLEVWGSIYKAQYRLRFLYAQLPGECLLMGQEIIEYSKL
jgi:hypothetical protein